MIPTGIRGETRPRRPKQAVSEVSPNRVVPKPVPQSQVQNARGYHIEQLRRRYSPKETTNENGGTSLLFKLGPSDPDFPFELDHLECDLLVPAGYPKQPPQLRIKNKDIPRGFSINIEKGWDRLVEERRGATLLTLTNALDRKLEELLSEQKSETVKLTIFKDTRHLNTVSPSSVPETPSAKPYVPPRRYVPEETFTREQIAEAKARRAQETRQLESRMGRLPLYSKSNDGIVYTLPLEPRRRTELPPGLKPTKSVQLIIPVLYPLQPPRVLLNDVESKDAEGVEEMFTAKAVEQKQMTLMSHLNFLAQNIHSLARQAQASAAEKESGEAESAVEDVYIKAKEAEHSSALGGDDRSHIQVIPRPPEWCTGEESDGSSGSEDEDSSYGEEDEEDEEDGGATLGEPSSAQPPATGQTAERGTALTFPSIELRGIELLQVSILSLGVRCERCKTINEISGLKDDVEKTGSCRKCTSGFVVKFRPELVHQNSIRAGFIDAAGCTVTELLPRYDILAPFRVLPHLTPSHQPNMKANPETLPYPQHLHPHLRDLLDALGRPGLGAGRDDDQRVPGMPQPLHLQAPRGEVPSLRAGHLKPPTASPRRRSAARRRPAAQGGRGAPGPRGVLALPAQPPVVPVLVLRAGARVRPVPRRGRGPRARVGRPHGLRLVRPRADLPPRELRLLREGRRRPARGRVLGGRQGDAE